MSGARPEPFSIQIPDAAVADLRERLRRTRWPPAVEGVGWSQGSDLAFMQRLVEHWLHRYDWRAAERELNRSSHFRIDLGGQRIHFIHRRRGGFPLLLTHGWPGSFHEFSKVLPLLDGFDLVVPSLPGFGFSDPPARPGTSPAAIADLWAALMERLGYARYGLQGGDWGASVSTCLALRHPHRVAGLHLNYIPGSYRPDLSERTTTGEEQAFLESTAAWGDDEGGYSHQQRTRPQTLGFGLEDSPVGLAAWIVEKLRGWSDCAGEVERRFGLDDILTHISIYWFTRTATSSARLYLETRLHPLRFRPGERVRVPCAVARFALEAPFPHRSWIESGYDLRRFTELPRGGHFAAWEEPELLAQDVRAFFESLDPIGR